MWGRLLTCGGLAIRLPQLAGNAANASRLAIASSLAAGIQVPAPAAGKTAPGLGRFPLIISNDDTSGESPALSCTADPVLVSMCARRGGGAVGGRQLYRLNESAFPR